MPISSSTLSTTHTGAMEETVKVRTCSGGYSWKCVASCAPIPALSTDLHDRTPRSADAGGDRLPTGRRVHSVPAPRQVLDLLRRLQAVQGDPEQPEDRVFQGSHGMPMDGSTLYERDREIQKPAGRSLSSPVRRLRVGFSERPPSVVGLVDPGGGRAARAASAAGGRSARGGAA